MDTDYTSAILSSDYETALKAFFFNYSDSFESTDNGDERCIKAADIIMKHISDMYMEYIIDFIDDNDELIGTPDSKNIPQFSDINYVNTILSTVKTNPDGDYELFGYIIKRTQRKALIANMVRIIIKRHRLWDLLPEKHRFVLHISVRAI